MLRFLGPSVFAALVMGAAATIAAVAVLLAMVGPSFGLALFGGAATLGGAIGGFFCVGPALRRDRGPRAAAAAGAAAVGVAYVLVGGAFAYDWLIANPTEAPAALRLAVLTLFFSAVAAIATWPVTLPVGILAAMLARRWWLRAAGADAKTVALRQTFD